jgi:hypothetical protein
MKNIIIISLLFLVNCGLKFNSTFDVVNSQDAIANKILNSEDFNIDEAIENLNNQFVIESFNGLNPVSYNNIAVRNNLLLSILYYMNNNKEKHIAYHDTSLFLMKYNLIDDTIWSEGPYYYLYVQQILDVYKKVIGSDNELEQIRNNCNIWISKFSMPDGTLAPIGDSRRVLYNLPFNTSDRVVFDKEETLFKIKDITLFVRHPNELNKNKLNGHIHYDIGDFCVYKNDKCIVLPLGYPGNKKKIENGLDNILYKNSIYIEDLGYWRIKQFYVRKIERTDTSIFLEYKINSKIVSRKISINGDTITIEDLGSDAINLNVLDSGYDIKVLKGKEIRYERGLHCENEEDVVENKRAVIYNHCGETKIQLILK